MCRSNEPARARARCDAPWYLSSLELKTLRCAVLIPLAIVGVEAAIAEEPSPQKSSDTQVLEKVDILGRRADGYGAKDASTVTKTDTPIKDVPQSIEVRGRQILDDLGGMQSAYEVGKTVAGVFSTTNGWGDPGRNVPSFNIRGYSNVGGYLRDGHAINGWMSTLDMSYIDRVEFLKGTTSALYGGTTYGGAIGGTVNYVSKRPLSTPLTVADLTGGSYDFYRATIDYGRPLNDARTAAFRLNGALETGGSFRDYARHDTQAVAPALSIEISPRDTLTFLTTAVHSREVPALGLPMTAESFSIARSSNFIDPDFNRNDFRVAELTALYRHGFGERWRLDADLFYNHSRTTNYDGHLTYVAGGGSTLDGDLWKFSEDQTEFDLRLAGLLDTGPLQHRLLFGFNTTNSRYSAREAFGGGGAPSVALSGDTLSEIILPPAGSLKAAFDASTTSEGIFRRRDIANAFYVQDLVSIAAGFKLLVGARYDRYDVKPVGEGAFGPFSQTNPAHHTSPRLGLVYQPLETTSLYAVGAQSFSPNTGLTANNAVPPPELGRLREIGWKQEIGERVSANVAYYVLKRRNQEFCDPSDPTCTFVIVAGETRSRGIELDINGQVTKSFRFSVAASLMKGYVSEGEPGGSLAVGQEFAGVPRKTLNLFAVHSIGEEKRWEIGGGLYYASAAWADQGNTFRLPTLWQAEALAAYRYEKVRVQVNFKNLSNRKSFTSDGNRIFPSEPRSAFATLRYEM